MTVTGTFVVSWSSTKESASRSRAKVTRMRDEVAVMMVVVVVVKMMMIRWRRMLLMIFGRRKR